MKLVRTIAENYKLPYYTMSPTYSVCQDHGYLQGEQWKCPYCGRSSWGRATMEFVPRGVLRRSRCRSCGNEVLFLEDRAFDWIDDSGEWAVGPVPDGTVTRTERRAQKAVFHVIDSWGVPELYTVWRANIGAVSRAAGFPEPVREQAAVLLDSERERLSGKRSGLAGRFRR